MEIVDTGIAGPKLVRMRYFEDERGYFVEMFKRSSFLDAALPRAKPVACHTRSHRG